MASNPPQGVPQIYPRLAYADPTRAVEFLSRAFGLSELEEARVEDEDGGIALAEMALGSGRVMIGGDGLHGTSSPQSLGGCSEMIIVYVDDLDAHHTRARREGARIETEPHDAPWGDRRYEALDCEGHRWYFVTHLRDVPREEWMARLEKPSS